MNMRIPVPNTIDLGLEEARKILNEYKLEITYIDEPGFIANRVCKYIVDEEKEIVRLFVAKRSKKAISLDRKIDYVNNLGFVTGRNSKNKELFAKRNVGSTDLGICIDNKESLLFLYGDSFSGTDCNKGVWNSNFVATSKNKSFANNLVFDDISHFPNGLVKPLIQGQHDENKELNLDPSNHKEVTKIPTGGIRLNEDVYVFYMSIRYWGKPGEWFVTSNELLKARYNDLNNFKKVDNFKFDNIVNDQFGQIYPFFNPFDEEHIYLLCLPGGRFGNTCLCRVKIEDFEDISKYQVLTKDKEFIFIHEVDREDYFFIVNNSNSSEQSILFNPYLNKWVISNLTEKGITFLLADSLFEEFKEEVVILNYENFPSMYGGFIHPSMMDYEGKRMYMQVSQWSPIYNTSLFEVVFK